MKNVVEIALVIHELLPKERDLIQSTVSLFFPLIHWEIDGQTVTVRGRGPIGKELPEVIVRRTAKAVWTKLGRKVPIQGTSVSVAAIPYSIHNVNVDDDED